MNLERRTSHSEPLEAVALKNCDYRRILIIKPSSLGDVVHALPTLQALRARFPRASIAWLVKQQWAGLLERAEGLDEVWPLQPGVTGWLSEVPRLRAAGFELVVDLQGLFRSGAMAWLTGCPARIGFAAGREGSPAFYTHRVPMSTAYLHAVDRYLLVAAAVGASIEPTPEFRLRPLPEDRREVAALLDRYGLQPDGPWMAMSVSARWLTKRWPLECFAATADRVQQEGLAAVVLIGGPEDRPMMRTVKQLMRTKAVDLTGATGLGLLPALLESAALLLANDSGPLHVAAAVGTPVVTFYGPTSPVLSGPYGNGHRVLTSEVPCRPCFSRTCRNTIRLQCLKSIAPEQAMEAVRRLLRARSEQAVL